MNSLEPAALCDALTGCAGFLFEKVGTLITKAKEVMSYAMRNVASLRPEGGSTNLEKEEGRMNRKLTTLAIVAMIATLISLGGGLAQARPSLNVDDFALFTTRVEDSVTCTASGPATLHITATNFDPDEDRINIVFGDGDSVLIRVPTDESFSMTQVIGTSPGIDTEITIDPLDQDGENATPMVGWVSIRGLNVSCTLNLL